MSVPAGGTRPLILVWNDWFQSDQDFDMRVLIRRAEDGSFLGSIVSDNRQTGLQLPGEAIQFVNGFPFKVLLEIQVSRQSAPDGVVLRLLAGGGGRYQWFTPEGSISIPADTPGAIAVGATHWATDEIENFSGRGPTVDGRIKPDLVAPDGVANVSIDPFFGTSASAPTVAGTIALMKSRFDVFTTEEIVEILYGRAKELGPPGKDNVLGFGRLDLKGR